MRVKFGVSPVTASSLLQTAKAMHLKYPAALILLQPYYRKKMACG